jgi:flavin reductase ActVB
MPSTAPPDLVPISREAFADAMTRLVSGVTVVTARRPNGQACGLLVSSICSYSADPPSVLVAVGHERASYPALVDCTEFGVHMLGAEHERLAKVFASKDRDKFAGVGWQWTGDVPRLRDIPVFLRCARRAVLHHGDHAIIIGEVAQVEIRAGEPMVYYRRRFGWRLS